MKRIILLLLIIAPFVLKAQTSVYYPMLNTNYIWNIYYDGNCIQGTAAKEWSFQLTSDTLIDSENYKKLEVHRVLEISDYGFCSYWSPVGYWGALREDTALRQVFYVPKGSSQEVLLYDFSLALGDTIRGYMVLPGYEDNGAYVVSDIDSVLVDGNYRKRWKVGDQQAANSYPANNIIEGIGLVEGFIQDIIPYGMIVDMPRQSLICVGLGNRAIYPDSMSSCNYITAVDEIELKTLDFSIYPNPFYTSINLSSEEPIHSLELFNIAGQKVKEVVVDAKAYQWTLDLDAGVYFIKAINSNGESAMKKLIKY